MNLTQILEVAKDYEQEVAKLCSDLVERKSAHPSGNTDECVAYIKKYLDENQIENQHAFFARHGQVRRSGQTRLAAVRGRRFFYLGQHQFGPEDRKGQIMQCGRLPSFLFGRRPLP